MKKGAEGLEVGVLDPTPCLRNKARGAATPPHFPVQYSTDKYDT
jgi:hypothetical protein